LLHLKIQKHITTQTNLANKWKLFAFHFSIKLHSIYRRKSGKFFHNFRIKLCFEIEFSSFFFFFRSENYVVWN
jgi:hypothetical protein